MSVKPAHVSLGDLHACYQLCFYWQDFTRSSDPKLSLLKIHKQINTHKGRQSRQWTGRKLCKTFDSGKNFMSGYKTPCYVFMSKIIVSPKVSEVYREGRH